MCGPDFVLLTTRTVAAEAALVATAKRPSTSAPANASRILGRMVRDGRRRRAVVDCDIVAPLLACKTGTPRIQACASSDSSANHEAAGPRRVGDPGLEPGTSSLSEKRSNRLS